MSTVPHDTRAVPNHALRQLRAGKLAVGLGLNLARTVNVAQIAKTAGFDWLFIDCEHNSMDTDMAAQIASAALATTRPSASAPWAAACSSSASPPCPSATPRASSTKKPWSSS